MRRLGGSDQRPVHQLLVALVVGGIVSACALRYPPADPNVPLPAPPAVPVSVLLEAPVEAHAKEAPFAVRVWARDIGVWDVSCHVPPSWEAPDVKIAIYVPGVDQPLTSRIDHPRNSPHLVTGGLPCGAFAFCATITRWGDAHTTVQRLAIPGCNES